MWYSDLRVRTEGAAAPQSAFETKFGHEAAGSYTNSFRMRAETESFLGRLFSERYSTTKKMQVNGNEYFVISLPKEIVFALIFIFYPGQDNLHF